MIPTWLAHLSYDCMQTCQYLPSSFLGRQATAPRVEGSSKQQLAQSCPMAMMYEPLRPSCLPMRRMTGISRLSARSSTDSSIFYCRMIPNAFLRVQLVSLFSFLWAASTSLQGVVKLSGSRSSGLRKQSSRQGEGEMGNWQQLNTASRQHCPDEYSQNWQASGTVRRDTYLNYDILRDCLVDEWVTSTLATTDCDYWSRLCRLSQCVRRSRANKAKTGLIIFLQIIMKRVR